jgi:hypothetical protein
MSARTAALEYAGCVQGTTGPAHDRPKKTAAGGLGDGRIRPLVDYLKSQIPHSR